MERYIDDENIAFLDQWKQYRQIYQFFSWIDKRMYRGLVIEFYLSIKCFPLNRIHSSEVSLSIESQIMREAFYLYSALQQQNYDQAFSKILDLIEFPEILSLPILDNLVKLLKRGLEKDEELVSIWKE